MAERPGISAASQGAPFATRFGPPAPDPDPGRAVAGLSAPRPGESDGEEAADVR